MRVLIRFTSDEKCYYPRSSEAVTKRASKRPPWILPSAAAVQAPAHTGVSSRIPQAQLSAAAARIGSKSTPPKAVDFPKRSGIDPKRPLSAGSHCWSCATTLWATMEPRPRGLDSRGLRSCTSSPRHLTPATRGHQTADSKTRRIAGAESPEIGRQEAPRTVAGREAISSLPPSRGRIILVAILLLWPKLWEEGAGSPIFLPRRVLCSGCRGRAAFKPPAVSTGLATWGGFFVAWKPGRRFGKFGLTHATNSADTRGGRRWLRTPWPHR